MVAPTVARSKLRSARPCQLQLVVGRQQRRARQHRGTVRSVRAEGFRAFVRWSVRVWAFALGLGAWGFVLLISSVFVGDLVGGLPHDRALRTAFNPATVGLATGCVIGMLPWEAWRRRSALAAVVALALFVWTTGEFGHRDPNYRPEVRRPHHPGPWP